MSNWRARAACRDHPDPDIFFPEHPDDVQAALDICEPCPVRQECLDFAVANRVRGVYGGTTATRRLELYGVSVDNGSPFERYLREARAYRAAGMEKVGASNAEIAAANGTTTGAVYQAKARRVA